MKNRTVTIKSVANVTHDVLRIITDRPKEYLFTPGQATEISINKTDWKYEKRPFTFTCLPDSEHLEFTIKTYPERKGVTNQLLQLKKGDELLLHDVFGAISYQGEGVFIAGGAGVTPFISIFRWLNSTNAIGNNKLLFANKTHKDIILKQEFELMLGHNFVNILSDEKLPGYENGYINQALIAKHAEGLNKKFYVCGPPPMMDAIEKHLAALHVDKDSIVKEAF